MTRNVNERLGDILEGIARARVADQRMRLAETQGDETGVQIAFEAILHNPFVRKKRQNPSAMGPA